MGKHLDRLRKTEHIPEIYRQNCQNLEMGGFVGFVSTPLRGFEKLIPITSNLFIDQGINILQDDLLFIRRCLPVELTARNAAIETYADIWLQAMDTEPAQHCKDNAGRWAANTWLRNEGGKGE